MGQLEDRAVEAYTGAGSQMDVLLGASDLSEFSDRLEFMGALAQNDADLATAAENAQQQAQWAADRYAETIEEKTAELDQMQAKRAEIQSMLEEQKRPRRPARPGLPATTSSARRPRRQRPRRPKPTRRATRARAVRGDTTGGGGGYVPPPDASAAQIAIGAADSALGSPTCGALPGPTRSTARG